MKIILLILASPVFVGCAIGLFFSVRDTIREAAARREFFESLMESNRQSAERHR